MKRDITQTDQLSISRYFTNNERRVLESYAYMLYEDLSLGIISYKDKYEIKVKLNPQNHEFENLLIKSCVFDNGYGRGALSNFTYQLFEEITRQISYYGYSVYELVRNNINSKIFYLKNIRPFYDIKLKKRFVVQFIPSVLQKEGLPQYLKIPREKCFIFKFPDSLGGYKKYINVLNNLRLHSGTNKLGFLQLKKMSGDLLDYDYNKHKEMNNVETWKETTFINWHHRHYDSSELGLAHYRYGRLLKFKKSCSIIRNHILNELNNMVRKISILVTGTETNLEIEGFINLSEIDSAIEKWYKGEMDFKDIIEYI